MAGVCRFLDLIFQVSYDLQCVPEVTIRIYLHWISGHDHGVLIHQLTDHLAVGARRRQRGYSTLLDNNWDYWETPMAISCRGGGGGGNSSIGDARAWSWLGRRRPSREANTRTPTSTAASQTSPGERPPPPPSHSTTNSEHDAQTAATQVVERDDDGASLTRSGQDEDTPETVSAPSGPKAENEATDKNGEAEGENTPSAEAPGRHSSPDAESVSPSVSQLAGDKTSRTPSSTETDDKATKATVPESSSSSDDESTSPDMALPQDEGNNNGNEDLDPTVSADKADVEGQVTAASPSSGEDSDENDVGQKAAENVQVNGSITGEGKEADDNTTVPITSEGEEVNVNTKSEEEIPEKGSKKTVHGSRGWLLTGEACAEGRVFVGIGASFCGARFVPVDTVTMRSGRRCSRGSRTMMMIHVWVDNRLGLLGRSGF